MKLELFNFKCHEHAEFNFDDETVALISGKSGIGKTSIVEAIIFILFGTGRKIIRYGEKSCKVILNIQIKNKSFTIQRTKGPNRLTIMIDAESPEPMYYEDAAAQSIINEYFSEQYSQVGYLSQSSVNSFVLMGPQDKLSFLESLVFKTSELKDTKQKIQNLIKERTQMLQINTGKIEMLQSIIQDSEKTVFPEFPVKKKSGSFISSEKDQIQTEKNILTEITNASKHITSHESKLSKLSIMLKDKQKYEEHQQHFDKTYSILDTQLSTILDEIDNNLGKQSDKQFDNIEHYIEVMGKCIGEKKAVLDKNQLLLTRIREYVKYKSNHDELEINKIQYKKFFSSEKKKLTEHISKLETQILDHNIIKQYEQDIKDNTEYIDIVKQYRKEKAGQRQCIGKILTDTEQYETLINKSDLGDLGDLDDLDDVVVDQYIKKLTKAFDSKITLYEQEIQELISLVEKEKISRKSYKCPECSAMLSFCNKTNILIKTNCEEYCEDASAEDKLDKKKRRLQKFRKYQKMFQENNDHLKNINTNLSAFLNLYDREDLEIDDNEISEIVISIDSMKNSVQSNHIIGEQLKNAKDKFTDPDLSNDILIELQEKIKANELICNDVNIDMDIIDTYDETTLVSENTTISHTIDRYKQIVASLTKIRTQYNQLITENQEQSVSDTKLSLKSIQKHIEINTEKKQEYIKIKQDHEKILHDIETWKIKYEHYKKYQQQHDELISLQEKSDILKSKLQSIFKLKEFVKSAETILLERAIDHINQYVASYLDIFFQTDPISVSLVTINDEKHTSKNGQLSISINYKGMDADIGILSGGELQRVIIAYNLALSELFSVPIILLDECTSNLDQELTEIVVKGIKHNCKGKTIIMIAHQVVSGIFDNVISIE